MSNLGRGQWLEVSLVMAIFYFIHLDSRYTAMFKLQNFSKPSSAILYVWYLNIIYYILLYYYGILLIYIKGSLKVPRRNGAKGRIEAGMGTQMKHEYWKDVYKMHPKTRHRPQRKVIVWLSTECCCGLLLIQSLGMSFHSRVREKHDLMWTTCIQVWC